MNRVLMLKSKIQHTEILIYKTAEELTPIVKVDKEIY